MKTLLSLLIPQKAALVFSTLALTRSPFKGDLFSQKLQQNTHL